MTLDWAWRVVFMDGSQYFVRGTPRVWNDSDDTYKYIGDICFSVHNFKYFYKEPEQFDWPDGVYIMRLPDTDAAPSKPEG
jgi:hypothetical protein